MFTPFHARIERVLSGMAKRRMPQIVGKRNCLDKIFVKSQGTSYASCDLGDFKGVGQACAEKIAFMVNEDLRLVFKSPKCGRMHDSITIPLKLAAMRGRLVGMAPPP
jgi:hypothetical protein